MYITLQQVHMTPNDQKKLQWFLLGTWLRGKTERGKYIVCGEEKHKKDFRYPFPPKKKLT
jgi:hypothetical protein